MSGIVATPVHFPHQHQDPRLSPSHPMSYNTINSAGRKRKAEDEEPPVEDRMSTSPSPSLHQRPLPAQRITKRPRPATSGRPLPLPRLLETLDTESLRSILQTICQRHPGLGSEIEQTAPRPSVSSTLAVLKQYESALQAAFPFGGNPSSDYAYNRVRSALTSLLEALADFTPHFLPPNEPQASQSLSFLDSATELIHHLPDWSTFQHRLHKQNAYEEISKAWTLVIQEAAKRAGGIHIQYGGWDQKLTKHNQQSGGKLQEAVDEMGKQLEWMGGQSLAQQHGARGDDLSSVRQELLSGTYGSNLPVRVGPCSSTLSSRSLTLQYSCQDRPLGRVTQLTSPTQHLDYVHPTMAILGNLQAFIAVNGNQRLREYADEDLGAENENPAVAVKYIEAVSGAKFTIQVVAKKHMVFKTEAVEIQVYLDGKYVFGRYIYRSDVSRSNSYCLKIGGVTKNIGDHSEFRAFMFSNVRLTNEASNWGLDKRDRNDLGSITVKAFHVLLKNNISRPSDPWENESVDADVAVQEKKLKGLAPVYLTWGSLGQKQISNGLFTVIDRAFVDGSDHPFAMFRFRYCSKQALQSLLLIPRTPSPSSLADRPIESLSAEEAHQLLRQYQVFYLLSLCPQNSKQRSQTRPQEPKREIKSETDHVQKAIKHEQGVKTERPVKRERDEEFEELLASATEVKKAKPTETIDLSSD
ncbi:MAG: hypothetical protein Q9184_005478 [Pyrenodesmia sp. 2 TL-2023]